MIVGQGGFSQIVVEKNFTLRSPQQRLPWSRGGEEKFTLFILHSNGLAFAGFCFDRREVSQEIPRIR